MDVEKEERRDDTRMIGLLPKMRMRGEEKSKSVKKKEALKVTRVDGRDKGRFVSPTPRRAQREMMPRNHRRIPCQAGAGPTREMTQPPED